MRRKIVAGNWKSNGDQAFLKAFASEFIEVYSAEIGSSKSPLVFIAPPTLYLSHLRDLLKDSGVELSGQNVSVYGAGAYTGETSSEMLSDIGCQWCLVGHSERRTLFAETDELVLEKVRRLLDANIQPVLCVGETLSERDAGKAIDVVSEQLRSVYDALSVDELKKLVIAYEPVWAIGTGKTATASQAQEMHKAIRELVKQKDVGLSEVQVILYGGSVNASNASELFSQEDIDGGLVGGASLKVKEFVAICKSAV